VSGPSLVLWNVGVWSAQAAALWLVAAALARLAPVERPAARLALDETVLALVLLLPLLQPWQEPSASVRWSSVLGFTGPGAAAPPAGLDGRTPDTAWPPLAAAALLAGMLLQLGRLGLGLVRLRRIARDARPFAPGAWLRELRDRTAPSARFVLSDHAAAPATCGLRRPTILLPTSFPAMVRERQQAVALHELLHVRRRDWAVQLLEELVRAVAFFHPAVHWLVARVRLAREQCVDAEVVRRLGGREAYLESLLEVARDAARARAVPAAPFLRESHLRERVDLLLKEVSMSPARTTAHLALTAGAVLLAAACAASALPLQAAQAAAPSQASVSLKDEVTGPAEPKLVHKVNPAYPAEAKSEKVEGIFRIEARIGKAGAIEAAEVVASAPTPDRLKQVTAKKGTPAALEGDRRLAEAALAAVRQWRYEPVVKDGKPVEAKITITVAFKLS
jgi:D-alanyl-D-alanine endopeptidase (penicillin-binding protein 7)